MPGNDLNHCDTLKAHPSRLRNVFRESSEILWKPLGSRRKLARDEEYRDLVCDNMEGPGMSFANLPS